MNLTELMQAAVRWSADWSEVWDENGEPVDDDWDAVHALEDEARDIVDGLAFLALHEEDPCSDPKPSTAPSPESTG